MHNRTVLIVLIGQVGTMVLIGLWHGITWNFGIWGLWHGIGLFMHNRWVNFTRGSESITLIDRLPSSLRQGVGKVLTFHFITLGWVWFALPEIDLSLNFFMSLLGLSEWTG
jgi:D-alanyl-lipoteichoic acid acyltransferase DltB (MBOAT superfamily)